MPNRSAERAVRAILATVCLLAASACASNETPAASGTTAAINVGATPAPADTVTVWKTAACGCCNAWVDHMRENGFHVVAHDTDTLDAVKRQHGVGPQLASCHTAMVRGYVIEGHVPAGDVRRLLAERPQVHGLAVPGMPIGSPGMEGLYKQKYQVLAFTAGERPSVFAQH